MNYQPSQRFDLASIPEPREQVKRLMLATAFAIDGPVDLNPAWQGSHFDNTLLMSQARSLIMGTACRRPLLFREAAEISDWTNNDALIVRLGLQTPVSYDIRLQQVGDWFCRYQLWLSQLDEVAWLIPSAGEDSYIQLAPTGLLLSYDAPHRNCEERLLGLSRGRQLQSVARKGWF